MAQKSGRKEFAMNDGGPVEDVMDILDGLMDESERPAGGPELPDVSGLEAQVDEVVQGLSGAKSAARVYIIDVRQLEPYPNQPFKLYDEEKLRDLAEDIGRVGVLSPILARRSGRRLQILAGHNRWTAAKLAGLSEVPVLILEADDDQAALVVTSTNLRQRERLLPSEKAFAYKMQMEALKRQGRRAEEAYVASRLITEQTGDSRAQIHRYVRLTELTPGLLELLDKGKLAMRAAVAVSHLTPGNQERIEELIRDLGAKLTMQKAEKLRDAAYAEGAAARAVSIPAEDLEMIMLQEDMARAVYGDDMLDKLADMLKQEGKRGLEEELKKSGASQPRRTAPDGERMALSYDRIKEYLPPHATAIEAEDLIIQALRQFVIDN